MHPLTFHRYHFSALVLGVVTVCFCSTTYASFTLQVNANDKTFALVGSNTGDVNSFFGAGNVEWRITGTGGGDSGFNFVQYDNDDAFSTSTGTPGAFGFDTRLTSGTGSGGIVNLELRVSSPDAGQTISGSGIFQSYAGLSAANQANLEAQVGNSLALVSGSGTNFAPLQIQAAAVPEPSGLALLGVGSLFAVSLYRRRKT